MTSSRHTSLFKILGVVIKKLRSKEVNESEFKAKLNDEKAKAGMLHVKCEAVSGDLNRVRSKLRICSKTVKAAKQVISDQDFEKARNLLELLNIEDSSDEETIDVIEGEGREICRKGFDTSSISTIVSIDDAEQAEGGV